MQYQKNGKMRRKVQKKKNSRHNRLVSTSLANKWCLDSVHCSHLERSPVLTWKNESKKNNHTWEKQPALRICLLRKALPTGRQHFQLRQPTLHVNGSVPSYQASWPAKPFLGSSTLLTLAQTQGFPLSWEFIWRRLHKLSMTFFFSGLETKAISKHSATYGEYVWVNAQAFL